MYLVLILFILLISAIVWAHRLPNQTTIYVDLKDVCEASRRMELEPEPEPMELAPYVQRAGTQFAVDDAVVNKMLHSGLKNKTALDNRALWNKNTFKRLHESDLRDQAESVWWEDYDQYY